MDCCTSVRKYLFIEWKCEILESPLKSPPYSSLIIHHKNTSKLYSLKSNKLFITFNCFCCDSKDVLHVRGKFFIVRWRNWNKIFKCILSCADTYWQCWFTSKTHNVISWINNYIWNSWPLIKPGLLISLFISLPRNPTIVHLHLKF